MIQYKEGDSIKPRCPVCDPLTLVHRIGLLQAAFLS